MSKIKNSGLDQYGTKPLNSSYLEQLALKGLICHTYQHRRRRITYQNWQDLTGSDRQTRRDVNKASRPTVEIKAKAKDLQDQGQSWSRAARTKHTMKAKPVQSQNFANAESMKCMLNFNMHSAATSAHVMHNKCNCYSEYWRQYRVTSQCTMVHYCGSEAHHKAKPPRPRSNIAEQTKVST